MNWGKAVAVWLLIVVAESVNGTLRQLWIAPQLGEQRAHEIGMLVAIALITLISWWSARWLAARTMLAQLQVGLLWVVLFTIFEFGVGAAIGYSWQRMLADYDPTKGGLMGFGFVFLLFAPMLGARLRGVK